MLQLAELSIEERATAPVALEALLDLLEWYSMGDEERRGISPPECLGRDIRAKFGEDGFPIYRDLMYIYEPPLLTGNLPPGSPLWGTTTEKYEAALVENWQEFDRPHHWTDELIVDAMSRAQDCGWEVCGDEAVIRKTDSVLDDLAKRSGAKRAVHESEAADREAMKRAQLEAEVAAEFAAYETWLAAGEPNSDPLAGEHRARKRRILQHQAAAPALPTEIVENYRRQSEQYAAALMGPLPEHPELPIHQAQSLSRYWAHLPSGKMIYEGTRELWSPASLDKHIGRVKDAMNANGPGMLASTFLSQFRGVQSMGWDPSEPMIIEDRVLTQEGWIRCTGDRTFNRYVPSDIKPVKGDVSKWLDHIRFIYPAEADHIVNWCAHRVQRPGDKVNHALVFLGTAGIGKDTAVEPVATAIGRHNFASITAQNFFKSDFNGYLKSVMLRIDEVHDLGGESKYAFHDRTKPVIAAPPTVHHINEKFIPHYTAKNVCGVILTSNHRDALYLSPDDRRHFVCLSSKRKEDFRPGYFDEMHSWFENGGNEAVAYYLANLDISHFNAKAPPPQTEGWHMLVGAGLAPESGDLADLIETLGKPLALTLAMVRARMPGDSQLRTLFEDPKMRKVIPKRLAECGYVAVANPEARDSGGRWRIIGGKTTIYARQELSEGEQLSAARSLSTTSSMPPVPPPPC